jgi:hypothetical protein
MELQLDAPAVKPQRRADSPKKVRVNARRTRIQPLTRAALDGRTNAAKLYDRIVADVEADLSGPENLSTIERALVEAFAGATVTMHNLNTRLLLGEKIDLAQHAQAVSAMVRVASRLGLRRRARDISPTLSDYLTASAATSEADDAAIVDETLERTAGGGERTSDDARADAVPSTLAMDQKLEPHVDGIDDATLEALKRGEVV